MRFSRSILDELIPSPEPLVAGESNSQVLDYYAYQDYNKRPGASAASNVGLNGAYTSGYEVNSRGGYGHGKGGGKGGQGTFTRNVTNQLSNYPKNNLIWII